MSRPVFLLKSPPRIADDPYQKLFEAEGYFPIFIEVLESTLCNEKQLQDIVSSEPGGVYSGVVVTSSRAAEGWIKATDTILNPGNWSEIPFYAVGDSTAHALEPMTDSHPTKFSKLLILGAHTGKAESLARFILNDLPSRHTAGKLLYLMGDKNRDTFFRIMSEHNVPITSLMVYETGAARSLEDRIISAVREVDDKYGNHNSSLWIAFFAPSSSGFALPYLRQHLLLPHTDNSDEDTQGRILRSAKVAAIGTTTSEFLTNEAHLRVDALPVKPTAEHLVASIKAFDDATDHVNSSS